MVDAEEVVTAAIGGKKEQKGAAEVLRRLLRAQR